MLKIKVTERVEKEVELPQIFKTELKNIVTSYYRAIGKFVVTIKVWHDDKTFSTLTVDEDNFNETITGYEPVSEDEWREVVDKAKAYLDTVRI